MHRIKICILLALAFLPAAWPQASTTTIRGTVHDQGQAVIPKANVTLINTSTNASRTTATNDSGLYVFPGVFPGPYKLSVEFAGMQKYEATLNVQVQQDATVDVTLQVGQTATQLEVRDVTPLVITDNPTLGHQLERKRIEELPINGRSFSALLATVPGIEFGNGNASGRVQGYGMRVNTSTTIFDGAPINEIWEGYNFGRAPGLDSLQEMRVETNNSSAKFSRPNTIILTSKSGSNQFHGALFETNRNSGVWVARRRQDFFDKAPFMNRNEYGASVGGPIFVPKVYDGRNKTFFFFAYEASRSISNSTGQYAVPTAEMRNGDFTNLRDSQGRLQVLYDPYTTNTTTWARQPLSYQGVANKIDPARITPLAKFLFAMSPLPNLTTINPLIENNLVTPVRTPRTEDTTTLRIDHRFSDKDLIFGRFTRGRNDHHLNITPMLDSGIGDYEPTVTSNRHWPNSTLAITWEHTISPTFTNEVLLNGSRDYHWRGSGDRHTDYAGALKLPNPFKAFNWPSISDLGFSAYPFGSQAPFWLLTNYVAFQDNATKIQGKHELQFGFHFKYELIDKSATPGSGPFSAATLATSLYDTASTPTAPTARPQTGFGLANLELGSLNYNAMFRRPWYHIRRPEYSPYFQDNWKLTQRLTLNFGLRWEMRLPAFDKDGTAMAFSFDKRALVIGTTLDKFMKFGATTPAILTALRNFGGNVVSYQDAGFPQKLANTNWKEFGPRLGFAYRALDGAKAFVVRGGYRMSYYPMRLQEWILGQSDSVPVGTNFQNTVSTTALSPDGLQNYGLRSVPQYVAGVNTPDSIINVTDTRALARGFGLTTRDPSLSDGRVQDWNLTFEKEVMANTIARIGYIGNHGDKQQMAVRYNDATPDYVWLATKKIPVPSGEFASVATRPYDQSAYGNITVYTPVAYGNYNGVQLELERRFSKGFAYQLLWNIGNATWIGQDNVDVGGTNNVPSINTYLPGTVPTDFGQRLRALNYARGPNTLKHQIRWNFIADLPFGKGRKFLGGSKGILNQVIGGWQVSGLGGAKTSWWSLPTGVYPNGNPIEVYKYQYPIEDCTSGTCYPGYLWWNGYIPSNRINSVDANGKPNGYMGIPANYKPSAAPLIPWGSTALPANAPANTVVSTFWDTNNVWVPLTNSPAQRTTYNDGLHPWNNQYMDGPWQWTLDASAVKNWNIKESVTLRFNLDFFNVFNHPNNPTGIDSTGLLSTRNSGVGARVTQLGLRLAW